MGGCHPDLYNNLLGLGGENVEMLFYLWAYYVFKSRLANNVLCSSHVGHLTPGVWWFGINPTYCRNYTDKGRDRTTADLRIQVCAELLNQVQLNLKGFRPSLGLTNLAPHDPCFDTTMRYENKGFGHDHCYSNQSISDGQTLVSSRQVFEFGFFSPGNLKNRYVGIWYKNIPDTFVWVANRGYPVTDKSGTLNFSRDGNLVLFNGNGSVVWSLNSEEGSKHPILQILDSGNLVLRDESMKQGWDLNTGLNWYLTPWTSADDPSPGNYYYVDLQGLLFLNLALFTTSPGLVTFSGQFCMESRKIIVTLLIFVDLLGDEVARLIKLMGGTNECRAECLKNCSCTGYAEMDTHGKGKGCLMWFGPLIDIRQSTSFGQDLYVRMPASELEEEKTVEVAITLVSIFCSAYLRLASLVIAWKKKRAHGRDDKNESLEDEEEGKFPLFDLITIAAATKNFAFANKIGEGGFGPVYKGVLPTGEEIAVKKLSHTSRQGLKELKNEVSLISRLQH
ncbi:G-type lectin S-receptor-like serine/threonine-protein kinase [Vitis vinifera]|uniref:G-type lectin S-receptor-like serine/threonine-protein kinase n=1 Tax=Vitis vinifera TaxID=29760 RepID=A0A438G943_VITVI|nr:G-type lectin S-receptor-like serine/threonine-protein kinase [Vitis vinifera]